MGTQDARTVGNFMDVLKMKAPNGSPIDSVVNTMIEVDHMTEDMPVAPANAGLSHHGLRTIQLPTGYLVDIGGSWKTSKSEREPFIEALCTIRGTYQAPKDTFTNEAAAIGLRLLSEERKNFIAALQQGLSNLMLDGGSSSGVAAANMSAFTGMNWRLPWTTYDNINCFSLGGSGSDLRSCWLMKPGISTVHMLYNPNHPTMGIEQDDKGEVVMTNGDDSTITAGEHRWDIMIEFMIQKGLCIRDITSVKRICNVPCGVSDYPGSDLVDLVIEASLIKATKKPGPWMLYCPERLYAKLVVAANQKLFVYMSDNNIYRTKLPMISPDIIIRKMDGLNKTIGSGETAIVAA